MRAIRWRLQFKSLTGVGCLVNIYEEDYTSAADTTLTGADVPISAESGVTQLTGTDDPFSYEDDDDENLLYVLRYKTGYINVVEKTYGALQDLAPSTNTHHYVEFYYGSRLDFTGYMQAQNFENDWIAAPRELHFPIMSPLGLSRGLDLNAINPPTTVSLATLLAEVVTGFDAAYERVILPDMTPGLEGTINSLVVSPANSNFSQSLASSTPPYDPISYEEFIEGLCNCFGFIVHDTPTALVFSKFDWGGAYCSYTIANLPTLASKTTVTPAGNVKMPLDNFVVVADNDGDESSILPVKKVRVSFEGDWVKSTSFDWNLCKFNSESHYGNCHAAWFECVNGMLTGTYLLTNNNFRTDNYKVVNTGACVALTGSETQQEFCILTKIDTSWTSSTELFRMTFAERPTGNHLIFSMTKKFGNLVYELKGENEEGVLTHHNVEYVIMVGSQYYDCYNEMWTNTLPTHKASGLIDLDVNNVPDGIITLIFFPSIVSGAAAELVATYDIKIEEWVAMYDEYKYIHTSEETTTGAAGSDEEGEVNMLFSYAHKGSNLVGDTPNLYSPVYPYLYTAQSRIQVPFRADLPSNPYQPMFSYWIEGWRWRLLAVAFAPRDDEYTLTLHRSSSLDDIVANNSITIHGENCTSDAPAYAADGEYLQFTITPDAGYQISYVQVLMGMTDVTADCYNGGVVSIESVTDDIVVYAFMEDAPLPDYLCFEALEDGAFTLTIGSALPTSNLAYVEWSKDGLNWTKTNNVNSTEVTISVNVLTGEKVYWRGSGTRTTYGWYAERSSIFSSTARFNASGDLRSLIYRDDFESHTGTVNAYGFSWLFKGNDKLIDASGLKLVLAGQYAYGSTFNGCTNLTRIPALFDCESIPAYCFSQTFGGCTNLQNAMSINATTIGVSSMYYMYRDCSSLTSAPDISSVQTLSNQSFYGMFYGCGGINNIKCLVTDLTPTNCIYIWAYNVADTGTFTKAAGVEWPSGASGIPSGWTVTEE